MRSRLPRSVLREKFMGMAKDAAAKILAAENPQKKYANGTMSVAVQAHLRPAAIGRKA